MEWLRAIRERVALLIISGYDEPADWAVAQLYAESDYVLRIKRQDCAQNTAMLQLCLASVLSPEAGKKLSATLKDMFDG